ncbi:MAG: hypothetical protein ACI4R8_03650 [Candidatus Caccovivens sp.]
MKKKFFSFVLAFAFILTGAMCLTACGGKPQPEPQPEPEKLAYVSMDINPGIELIVDKDNKVVSVRGENEDGLVLLYEETGIKGENVDVAVNKIIDLAVEYGYLDENNKVVDTIVSSDDNNFANTILSKVNTSITAAAPNLGLTVTTNGEGAYSLLRKMDEFKAQFPNNSAIQNMSVSKFKLALSVSETGEISLDAAAVLDDRQLLEMLKDASSQIEAYATKEFLAKKTEALSIFDKAATIPAYSVYTQYYLENMTSHLFTAYYGGAYQMYASAAKAFDVVNDVVKLTAEIDNYKLNETDVQGIVGILGMQSADALKDSQGNITIESIEAYADKLFKNTPASETLEQTKIALTNALNTLETSIKEKLQPTIDEYLEQVNQAKATAEQVLTSVESVLNNLPENAKNIFNGLTTDLREILDTASQVISGDSVDTAKLQELTDKLNKKADEYLAKIKVDLSAEEYATLEARFNAKVAEKSAEKQVLDSALTEAANDAKTYLQNLKDARKNVA